MADPAQTRTLIVEGDQLHTGYVTHERHDSRPSTMSKVRQAVNMAINKERIVQIINNRAVPATQPLPPAMPGYNTDYKGYAYDPEGRQEAAGRSGRAGELRRPSSTS